MEREFPHGLPSELPAALVMGPPGWPSTWRCVCAGDRSLGGRAHAGVLRRWEAAHTREPGKAGEEEPVRAGRSAGSRAGWSCQFLPGPQPSITRSVSGISPTCSKVAPRQLPTEPSPSSCAQADPPGPLTEGGAQNPRANAAKLDAELC